MGRPLNKKYFGNRNIGSASVTSDNGIGGQGVASVVLNALGAYTTRPTITFAAPTLPSGVTALGTITSEVESVTSIDGAMAGYTVGQLLTVDGTDVVLRVATIGGTGGDDVTSVDFVGGNRGTFTTLPNPSSQNTTSNGAGVNCTVVLRFRAKAVVVTEQGSGYVSAPTPTFTQSVTATSVVLTTDSGSAGTVTNDENAIICTAFIPAANGGTAAVIGDIVKQNNDKRYKVKTAEGTGICRLKTTGAASAAGEMSIKATDSAGGNYLVAKLTARKVVLVPAALGGSAGTQFASGASAKWTFGSAVLNTTVTIENA
jgi:hypothetical protein